MFYRCLKNKSFSFVLLCFFLNSFVVRANDKAYVIGSLGDSITTGTNAKGWGQRKQSNWSTGTDKNVVSHYQKIKNLLGENVKAFNVAKSGATSHDLARQTSEIIKSNPDYVTLLIGANDVCSWGDDHGLELKKFKERVQETINKLVAHNSEIKILIAPVPDMYHLWQLGAHSSCQFLWDMANVCKRLLHSQTSESVRLRFKEQLNDLNNSLHDVSNDSYDNVRYDVSLSQYKFSKTDVSRSDCFHPSIQGQKVISDMTWKAGWYN